MCAFSRDLQRPNVDRLLRGGVGDALVGQGHHPENDHQNRCEEEIFHKLSGALEAAGCMSTGTAAAFLRKEIASDHAHKHARGERLVGMVV